MHPQGVRCIFISRIGRNKFGHAPREESFRVKPLDSVDSQRAPDHPASSDGGNPSTISSVNNQTTPSTAAEVLAVDANLLAVDEILDLETPIDQGAWARCLELLEPELPTDEFTTWIRPLQCHIRGTCALDLRAKSLCD